MSPTPFGRIKTRSHRGDAESSVILVIIITRRCIAYENNRMSNCSCFPLACTCSNFFDPIFIWLIRLLYHTEKSLDESKRISLWFWKNSKSESFFSASHGRTCNHMQSWFLTTERNAIYFRLVTIEQLLQRSKVKQWDSSLNSLVCPWRHFGMRYI